MFVCDNENGYKTHRRNIHLIFVMLFSLLIYLNIVTRNIQTRMPFVIAIFIKVEHAVTNEVT